MGTICCKSETPKMRKPFRFSPSCKTKCSTSTESAPIHISEPVTLMHMPKALSRSEVSQSSLYYSCLTGKEAGLTFSRNNTNTNRPAAEYSSSQVRFRPYSEEELGRSPPGLIKLETKDMLVLDEQPQTEEADMDSGEEKSGFFEAHSFFKDDDEPSTTTKEESSPINELKESTTFSRQRTWVSDTVEHVSPRQKHSEHVKWINEMEEVIGQMKRVLEDTTVEYEKVYETKRTLHNLGIYLNSFMDNEGHKRVRIKADWYMPCAPEDYIRYINSFEGLSEVIRNAENIEQSDTFEDLEDHQFGVYYLCLPGLQYSKPKDFVMLKSFRKLGKDRWCDVFKSIDCDRHPEYEGRVRIKVIMGGHLAFREADTEEKDQCKVQLYYEVQLDNVNSQNRTVKFLLQELKQYAERCVMNVNRFGLYHSEKTGLKNLDLLL